MTDHYPIATTIPDQRLTQLPRDLSAAFRCPPPPYGSLWRAAVEGRFPAHQVGGRWHYRPADLQAIGAALGLRVPDLQAA